MPVATATDNKCVNKKFKRKIVQNQLIDISKQVQAKAFCSRLNLFCYFFTDFLFNLFYR